MGMARPSRNDGNPPAETFNVSFKPRDVPFRHAHVMGRASLPEFLERRREMLPRRFQRRAAHCFSCRRLPLEQRKERRAGTPYGFGARCRPRHAR
jgi:hypothetical protein